MQTQFTSSGFWAVRSLNLSSMVLFTNIFPGTLHASSSTLKLSKDKIRHENRRQRMAKWQMLSDHIHLALQVILDHRIAKKQVITCQTAPLFHLVLQKTILLYVCDYTCVEFVWVNSATDICKEMKQHHHNRKTFLVDYLVITTYFATGPSCFAICCYFLWKKNKQNFIRLTVNYFKFSTCIEALERDYWNYI